MPGGLEAWRPGGLEAGGSDPAPLEAGWLACLLACLLAGCLAGLDWLGLAGEQELVVGMEDSGGGGWWMVVLMAVLSHARRSERSADMCSRTHLLQQFQHALLNMSTTAAWQNIASYAELLIEFVESDVLYSISFIY